ncbi:MAG: MerR family transcriptional regulator [Flavobacteriaceae bacterium]|nr:MerR family transcriptional regulator [Flavobacteriaceae bacterium]
MLNNIKTQFSIKDLENFTGIKAHTIRIWEKRYGLLEPQRTDTNIRYYNSDNFLKLLNVNLLYNNGFKISKIAELSDTAIELKAREVASNKAVEQAAINQLKVAMVNFDAVLFNETYNKLLASKSFREIFTQIFIPFLEYIGLLWQTKSIKPAHEHFISNLIIQKIQSNIEKNQSISFTKSGEVFVLYLPMDEIHELGLLYLHYELSLRGLHSIYLGPNIAIEHLSDLTALHDNINFISYFTVQPPDDEIYDYLHDLDAEVLKDNHQFWFLGRKALEYSLNGTLKSVKAFKSVDALLKVL